MKTFFAFLDILGFKKIVENNSAANLENIVKHFFADFEKTIETSRTVEHVNQDGTSGATRIQLDSLNFRLYSDSILIWATDEHFTTFRNLLEAVSCLVSYGLQNGFPLRGALNYGELFVFSSPENEFFSNESIYGKALVEAYTLEGEMQWAGCVLTLQAWQQVCTIWRPAITGSKDPNAYFYRFPLLSWYPIPMKNGIESGIAINWNSAMAWDKEKVITPETIVNSFSAYGKGVEPNPHKLDETLRFLKYTTELQKHCFVSAIPESRKRCELIPTPQNPHPDYFFKFLPEK